LFFTKSAEVAEIADVFRVAFSALFAISAVK